MIETITSADNKKLKLMSLAAVKKGREKHGVFLVEGRRITEEAVEYAADRIKYIFVSNTFAVNNNSFVCGLDAAGFSVYTVSDKLFRAVSDTTTPQGIAALIEIPVSKPESADKLERVLILDGVSEPGNMGTIIRTAEAAGIDAIYLMKGCADIYNPKVVRSTMGSIFRMRFVNACFDDAAELKKHGFEVVASALDDSVDLYEHPYSNRCAVIIGNEAHGVSDELSGLSDIKIRIPMQGRIESLNAAVAAGILMYTVFR